MFYDRLGYHLVQLQLQQLKLHVGQKMQENLLWYVFCFIFFYSTDKMVFLPNTIKAMVLCILHNSLYCRSISPFLKSKQSIQTIQHDLHIKFNM